MKYNKYKKIYPEQRQRVFIMMSGGVDSSVAAFLLATNKKYDVVGCFIKGYNIDGCQKKDAQDARRTAEKIGIPLYVFDLEKEYKKKVVDYMLNGYKKGITPNPDVMCNKEIKFGLFLKKALELGADYVATGHYVRLSANNELNTNKRINKFANSKQIRYSLMVAKDKNKDQSYFLWTLTQEQLKHCLFPIGDYLKSEVRRIAKKAGLPTAAKKDSQGICFLGKVKFSDFLEKFLPIKKGGIIFVPGDAEGTTGGKKVGVHKGVWFYTIGQRHIGVANRGTTPAVGEAGANGRGTTRNKNFKPLYVVGKDIKKNILFVAEGEDNPASYKKDIQLSNVNFINLPYTPNSRELVHKNFKEIYVRIRYRQPLAKAKIFNLKSKTCALKFDKPVRFAAPGQSAVFYDDKGELLGGGIIEK